MTLYLTPSGRVLVLSGLVLFLIGLLQGVAVPMFTNPRLGLSAHLAAVQSGMALMIVGAVWSMARWSARVGVASCWATIGGMCGVWLALTLAAIVGASEAFPIAGAGFAAAPWIEAGISALAMISGGTALMGWLAFTLAAFRSRSDTP